MAGFNFPIAQPIPLGGEIQPIGGPNPLGPLPQQPAFPQQGQGQFQQQQAVPFRPQRYAGNTSYPGIPYMGLGSAGLESLFSFFQSGGLGGALERAMPYFSIPAVLSSQNAQARYPAEAAIQVARTQAGSDNRQSLAALQASLARTNAISEALKSFNFGGNESDRQGKLSENLTFTSPDKSAENRLRQRFSGGGRKIRQYADA